MPNTDYALVIQGGQNIIAKRIVRDGKVYLQNPAIIIAVPTPQGMKVGAMIPLLTFADGPNEVPQSKLQGFLTTPNDEAVRVYEGHSTVVSAAASGLVVADRLPGKIVS